MKKEVNNENWVDFMEEELDPSLHEDFKRLLDHSENDRKVLSDLKRLRGAIEKADKIESKVFNDELFDKIMMKVERTNVQPLWQVRITQPKFIGTLAASAALAIVTVSVLKNINNKNEPTYAAQEADKAEWIVQESIKNPDVFVDAMNTRIQDDDLVFDALASQFEGLSEDEVGAAVEEILNR